MVRMSTGVVFYLGLLTTELSTINDNVILTTHKNSNAVSIVSYCIRPFVKKYSDIVSDSLQA